MLHEPTHSSQPDVAVEFKSKLGIKMFFVYSVFYAGFVAINFVKPLWMELETIFGLNLASLYGISLIVVALIMALVYNHRCTKQEALEQKQHDEKGGN